MGAPSTQMSQPPHHNELRGVLGLANLGNTCYMNAILQAWRNCPEWTLFCKNNSVDEHVADKDAMPAKFLYAYKDLLQSLWGGTGPAYVKPMGFYDHMRQIVKGTLYEDFVRRTPQDAHEFLVWMLDQLFMATQKKVNMKIANEERLQEPTLGAQRAWKAAFESNYSPLTDLIFGLFHIQYTCGGCSAVHTRWETFNVLKVPLERGVDGQPPTLADCIRAEFKNDVIDDYSCEACKQKTKTTKRIRIWKLPKVLLVTLRRFMPTGGKDGTPIRFDGAPILLTDLFSQESAEQSRTKNYKCFASVDHHGNHMGGHYTAQVLSPIWHKWHRYDDETALGIDKPQFGSSTYILMFR